MSRGLGKVQRAILLALASGPTLLDLDELASLIYGVGAPTRSQRKVVVRALRMPLPKPWTVGRIGIDRRLFVYNAKRTRWTDVSVRLDLPELSSVSTTFVFEG